MSDTATTIKKVRKHYAAQRTINRNMRLRRYQGRNSASTIANLDRHRDLANDALRTLPHRLQGLLWEEHNLADRISANADDGHRRPELRNRIRVLRNVIRTEVGAADNPSQVIG
jgi:hypothetical protein